MGYFDLPQRTSIDRNCQRCVRSLWSANHEILYHVHDSRDSEPPQIEPPGFIFERAGQCSHNTTRLPIRARSVTICTVGGTDFQMTPFTYMCGSCQI